MRSLDVMIDSMDMSLSKLWEFVMDGETWHAAVHEAEKSWTRLNNWTTTRELDFGEIGFYIAVQFNNYFLCSKGNMKNEIAIQFTTCTK